jgi:nucleoside-diphosphate-sugar epimerase
LKGDILKVLFIGGTGNISTSVSKLCIKNGIDLYLLNRGTRGVEIPGAKVFKADISDIDQLGSVIKDHKWDSVVNWIAFTESEVERDINLFADRTKQYIFISSASVYQKPPVHPVITESTPLYNPFWEYSRNKIACEDRLNRAYREENFPAVIVRPSLTYDTVIPVALGGWTNFNIIERLKKGDKIIIHGDGSSLWTITHAEDFAKGFVGLIGHEQATGHAFHITSDEILTWDQIYQDVADAVGVEPNIIHIPSDFICRVDETQTGTLLGDKARSGIFDNTKIKMFVPGYRAVIPFKQGIKRTLAWFNADPKRQVISKELDDTLNKIIREYEKK